MQGVITPTPPPPPPPQFFDRHIYNIKHCHQCEIQQKQFQLPQSVSHPYNKVIWLRDWPWERGSYGNNTQVIFCPVQGRHESAALNKSQGCCCRNSRPTIINPDHNMTEQLCIKRIWQNMFKISPNRVALSTCLHCDITHLSLTTGVVALHIPSWRVWEHE